ncbi:MAG: hypothetical protein K8T20_12995 [Planctomycetes bacterium]|nr:hypothetical protein [Planctomycetota bacterium]
MRDEIAGHPLTRPFWKQSGTTSAKNNSMTEDDFDYEIRLDEDSVELTESRTSYYDSSSEVIGTLKGRWEPLRVTQENVALKLSGVDRNNKPVERFLVLWDDDTDYGDLAWWAKASRLMDDRTVTLAPASAVARGLPPLRIRVCYDRLPFLPQTFPDARTYLSFSGPPGGPLFLSIHPLPQGVRDNASLEAFVTKQCGAEKEFLMGGSGTLDFRGQACPAQVHFSGTQNAAMAVCSVAIPGGTGGVLLVFGHGASPGSVKDVQSVAEYAPIARLLKRLSWEPG